MHISDLILNWVFFYHVCVVVPSLYSKYSIVAVPIPLVVSIYYIWIYNNLCNQCLLLLMLWVRISIKARCTTLCDTVCQWIATGLWFSPGLPVSSKSKTDHHDITEILLKMALNTIKQANRNSAIIEKRTVLWQTEHIRGHVWQTEHIRGHLWQTEHIRGPLWQKEHIRGHLWQTEPIRGHLWQTEHIRGPVWQKEHIRGHLWQTEHIRAHLRHRYSVTVIQIMVTIVKHWKRRLQFYYYDPLVMWLPC